MGRHEGAPCLADRSVLRLLLVLATADGTSTAVERYGDIGRQEVREASIIRALDLVIEALGVKL